MLETVTLPGSERLTTRLGFGGSGLMGGLSERESLRLLDAAYESGIRHFDVAPSYGHGQAERCLGRFLKSKPDATVTTKYGILPPPRAGMLDLARRIARPVARRLPAVRRRLAQAAAGMTAGASFSAAEARMSLDNSRRWLQRNRIDCFLLHEADAGALEDPRLLEFLEQVRDAGTIGTFGIGSERERADRIWHLHPDFCPVLQFESSLLAPAAAYPGSFQIHHRTISGALRPLAERLAADPNLCHQWSTSVDADLRDHATLAGLLLGGALVSGHSAMVLFSSRNADHLGRNVRMCTDARWIERSRRLLALLQAP
jgi:D-threo-aldose 1-dehydrogenase